MASVRILGPIEAWSGEQRLEVGGPRQMALLAFLVVNANRAVPADVIIESLWGSGRSGSDNRLQMAVTRLRRALAPLEGPSGAVLRTVSGGYLLALEPAELDAETFTRRIHDGITALQADEPETARAALIEALTLWRGPPLAEVSFEDFAQPEIRRLQELRLTALENRIEADLRLGYHAQLIGELEGLLAEDATRERMAGQLMLALYRSGRQKEALEVFHRIRVHLAGEVGLEPGPSLQQLQAQILEQAPSLLADRDGQPRPPPTGAPGAAPMPAEPPPQVSAPLPNRLAPHGPRAFVNRRAERAALVAAIDDISQTGLRAAIVTGEPGIGKTRLVSEVARHAHEAGTLVLAGRCDERLELPYLPFVEALEYLVEHAPAELLKAHVEGYGDSLARLVPGLGRRVASSPAAEPPTNEFARFALFRAVEGLLEATCAGEPVVLVLEDLHWADPGTLRLLWRLISSPRTMPLMLLATCRVSDVGEEHLLRQFLADAHREPNVTRLELTGLAPGDVAELLRAIGDGAAHAADERLVNALESSTDGNPFFITELTRSLMESGELSDAGGRWHLDVGADVPDRLPVSISETLAARVRRLGESARSCLGVAAVIGEEFDLDLVAEVLVAEVEGSPSAVDALDLGVRRAVLLEVPGRPGRFRFVHALMQRYLYRSLGSAARTELHRRVAQAMEARSGERRWTSAELARHWQAAGDGEWRNALHHAALAGDEALAQLAPDEARRWYEAALELLGRHSGAPPSQLSDLLVRRGEAERQAGDLRFRETLLEAAELAQQTGDDRTLVRAALANSRGMQSQTGVVDEARIAILQAALEIVGPGDSPERARLLAMHAAELMYSPDWERRIRLSDEALAIARRLDDPHALATVLNMRFVSLLTADTHSERLANTVEAVAAAERLRNPPARFYAYHWRGYACIEAGDVAVARTWLIREREIAEAFRQPTALWLTRADEANLAIVAGDLEAADRLAAEAFAIGRHGEPDAAACFAAQRTSIAFASGRLGELAPLLSQTVAENPGVPGFRAILALAQQQAGRLQEAEELLTAAAAAGFSDVPRDVTWLAVMCIYAQVAAQLEVVSAAAIVYELLEPWEGQLAFPAFGVWGPVALHLGSLALCGGDVAAAARHLSQAREEAAHAGAPLWQAWAESLLSQLAETAS